jgi:hypothetical protein
MKNQYIIVRECQDITLYYNDTYNKFICMRHAATVYTNKRIARDRSIYADRYGTTTPGKTRVINL